MCALDALQVRISLATVATGNNPPVYVFLAPTTLQFPLHSSADPHQTTRVGAQLTLCLTSPPHFNRYGTPSHITLLVRPCTGFQVCFLRTALVLCTDDTGTGSVTLAHLRNHNTAPPLTTTPRGVHSLRSPRTASQRAGESQEHRWYLIDPGFGDPPRW